MVSEYSYQSGIPQGVRGKALQGCHSDRDVTLPPVNTPQDSPHGLFFHPDHADNRHAMWQLWKSQCMPAVQSHKNLTINC